MTRPICPKCKRKPCEQRTRTSGEVYYRQTCGGCRRDEGELETAHDQREVALNLAWLDLVAKHLTKHGIDAERAFDIKQTVLREATATRHLAAAMVEIARLKKLVAEISVEQAA